MTKKSHGISKGPWRIDKCQCGHASCNKHGTSNGSFWQGNGYSLEDVRVVAQSEPMLRILEALCEDPTYEAEYAGRMETYCRGCDILEVKGKIRHEKKCVVVNGNKVIAEILSERIKALKS